MPRSSRRRRVVDDLDDDDEDDEQQQEEADVDDDEEEEEVVAEEAEEMEDDDEDEMDDDVGATMFSQQVPMGLTQEIHPVKDNEQNNYLGMSGEKREKAACDLTRVVLFKALRFEPIDRTRCLKEAGLAGERIGSALFNEVRSRLQNLFGFTLSTVPRWMEDVKGMPTKFQNQYYVVNQMDDDTGLHTKQLHSEHDSASIEKGLLMLILGLIYCKGDPRANDGSRWLLDQDLYELLHRVDDNIPSEPPSTGSKKKRTTQTQTTQQTQTQQRRGGGGVGTTTPDVDAMLELFQKREYLYKAKATEHQVAAKPQKVGADSYYYTMGPRAALEVSRKQVIYFCSEVLGQEPDPTMLKEVEDEEEEEMETQQDLTMTMEEEVVEEYYE